MGTQTGNFTEVQRNEGVRVPAMGTKHANTLMDSE